jgi:hypothetical protein
MYTDMVDPAAVDVESSFMDAMSWPVTVGLCKIDLVPNGIGVCPTLDGVERWPDFQKPNFAPGEFLRYTLWAGFQMPTGRWMMSGFHQFWVDRTNTGAHPLEIDTARNLNNWQANWADVNMAAWYTLKTVVPHSSQMIAFMATAGDARLGAQVTVKERTQIVTVPLVMSASYPFVGDATTPPPTPTPTPPADHDYWAMLCTIRDEQILTKLAAEEEAQRAQQRHDEARQWYENTLHEVKNNGAGIGKIQDQLHAGFIIDIVKGRIRPSE